MYNQSYLFHVWLNLLYISLNDIPEDPINLEIPSSCSFESRSSTIPRLKRNVINEIYTINNKIQIASIAICAENKSFSKAQDNVLKITETNTIFPFILLYLLNDSLVFDATNGSVFNDNTAVILAYTQQNIYFFIQYFKQVTNCEINFLTTTEGV